MVYITEVHMSSGGTGHEHNAAVRWEEPSTSKSGEDTRQEMVEWVDGGGAARVRDSAGDDVLVGVVNATPPYIRTYADGVPTDNLLYLPRY
jgi:hypothetical protein